MSDAGGLSGEGNATERHFADPAASDAPLEDPAEDRLGRAEIANRLAEAILKLDARHGFVLGIQGPWGTGKTTLMNFIRLDLDAMKGENKPITIRFNPWWFSSSQDILLHFFNELSTVVGRSDASRGLEKISLLLGVMGKVAVPLSCIPGISELAKTAGSASEKMQEGVRNVAELLKHDLNRTRTELEEALRGQSSRIVVFVDDLDRLDAAELKQMLAIVKSVANLPNVLYVLALDRVRAASVLKSGDEPDGAAYLDKVIQVGVDLPLPTPQDIQELLDERLVSLMELEIEDTDEQERLAKLYLQVLQPLIRTPRDANRLLTAWP